MGLVSVSASHPVDLRRAMAARPWDFGWLLLRAGLCRLAGPIRRHNPLMRPSTYEKELTLNTDSKFPAERRGDVAKLRIQASQIGNVRRMQCLLEFFGVLRFPDNYVGGIVHFAWRRLPCSSHGPRRTHAC